VFENPIRENNCELPKVPNDEPTMVNDDDPLVGTTWAVENMVTGDL